MKVFITLDWANGAQYHSLRQEKTRAPIGWTGETVPERATVFDAGNDKPHQAFFGRRVDALRFAKAHGLTVTNWARRGVIS